MNEKMAALAVRFRERLSEDLAILAASPPDMDEVKRVVHQLAGAAGMFGFDEIGRLAAVLDAQLYEGRCDAHEVAALVACLEAELVRPG